MNTLTKRGLSGAACVVALLGAAAANPAVAVTIDSFTTNQAPVPDPPGNPTVATGGADIIGFRRALTADLISGAGPVTGGVSAGVLNATVTATTPDSRGEVVVTWDGDATAANLNYTGLAGVNLTAGNHGAFRIRVNSAANGNEIVLEVYTSATLASRAAIRLPPVASASDFYLSYPSNFVPFLGTGADFANVGAIVLTLRSTESTTSIDIIDTVAPSLGATKRDLDLANSPIAAPVLEGTTYKYRVTIFNTGAEARTVDLSDTIESNLTLNAATILAQPALINDAYETMGNVDRTIAAPGLLANDVDPDQNGAGPALLVNVPGSPVNTALGGTATLAADGSFTYTPPIGVGRAVDTFPYTVTDNDGQTATAQATIHIGRRVWFVDSSHAGTNQGTFANPFQSFTAANLNGAGGTGDVDGPGDIIFVYAGAGAYNVGLVLEADQQLIGQGEGLLFLVPQVVPPGPTPVFTNTAGNGILLATNNTLRGFDVGNTTQVDIVGTSFGTLTVSNVALTGTGGALDLTTGILAATFDGIASTNAPARGVNLDAATGFLVVSGSTAVTDSAGAAIRVINGGTSVSTYTFGNTTLSSTVSGIDLSASASSTFNFSTLSATTDAGPGIQASNAGTINLGGSANTITATGGAAVDITSTSLGSGMTFSTLSSSGTTLRGIHLDNVTATGAFTGSGGSLAGASTACFDVNGGSSNVSYAGSINCTGGRVAEVTGRTGGTVTLSGALTGNGVNTGISVASNSGGTIQFTSASKTLDTSSGTAVNLASNTGATIHFSGGGMAITTSSGSGFTATGGATGITVQGTGNTITSGTGTALNVASSTIGASGLTFQRISSNGAPSGIVLNNTGAGALVVTGTGSAGSGGTVQSSTGNGVSLTSASGTSLSWMTINGSGANGLLGTSLSGLTLSNVSVTNNGNAADEDGIDLENPAGAISLTTVTATGNAYNNLRFFDSNNTGGDASLSISGGSYSSNSNANGNHGALIDINGTAILGTSSITGATFNNNKVIGIQLLSGGSAAINDFTISTSTFQDTGTGNSQEISMDVSKAGTSNLTAKVLNNTISGHNSHGMNFFTAAGAGTTGTYNARISGNTIGNAAVAGSGSLIGNCMRINLNGDAAAAVLVDSNQLRQCPNGRGIEVIGRNGTSVVDVTVTNNDVNTNDVSGFPLCAILVQSNDVTIPKTVRSDVRGNTVPSGTAFDVVTTFIGVVETGTSTSQLVDTAPASANCTAQLTSTNTGSASANAGCSLIAGPINTPPL